MKKYILKIANKKFKSRLILGTVKYKNMRECAKAIKISAEIFIAFAHSLIFLYFTVPNISLDLNFLFAIFNIYFFINSIFYLF